MNFPLDEETQPPADCVAVEHSSVVYRARRAPARPEQERAIQYGDDLY